MPWRIGTRISVTISPGRAAVSYGPRWNSRAGTVRSPFFDRMHDRRPRARDITADRSSDGSAWHSDPPTVPRLRTIGSAITRSASREDRVVLVGDGRLEQLAVPGHRPDADLVTFDSDVGEVEIVDVDQVLRSGESELHHRQQAVASGDEPGLGPEPVQQCDGVVDARRSLVLERRWYLHGSPDPHLPRSGDHERVLGPRQRRLTEGLSRSHPVTESERTVPRR